MEKTYQAFMTGGGSVLEERFGFRTEDAARRWIKTQLRRNSNYEYGCYRVRLDDATWRRVTR